MMFFNFSQFFATQGPNAFYEEFLKTEGLTLEQILDHEDTVTEAKKSNAGLLAHLQPQILRLIQYIQEEPPSDASENQGHRYPFISCEILNTESMLGEFIRDPSLLLELFHYLEMPSPLNLTLVGYCASVSQRVLDRQSARVLDFLFQEGADYTPLLLRHIRNRSIAELVVSVLVVNSQLAARQNLLLCVLSLFAEEVDRETIVNVGFTLQEVIRRSPDVGDWRSLVSMLLSQAAISVFAATIASPLAGDQAATVLTSLIAHTAFEDVVAYEAANREEFNLSASLKEVLQPALDYLTTPVDTEVTVTSYGSSASLGQLRYSLILFVNTCIRALHSEIDPLMQEKDYIGLVTKLFLIHPWHSGLHLAFEGLVRTVIEESSQLLKGELMERTDLVSVLAALGREAAKTPKAKHRLGFLGHVTKVANILLSASTTSAYVKQRLDTEEWMQFAALYLIPQNRVETSKYLEPSRKESEDSPVQEDLPNACGDEDEDNEEFEFKIDKPAFSPDELDKNNVFSFTNPEVSSDPEVEIEQGSDSYNNLNYWKVPISSEGLQDLE